MEGISIEVACADGKLGRIRGRRGPSSFPSSSLCGSAAAAAPTATAHSSTTILLPGAPPLYLHTPQRVLQGGGRDGVQTRLQWPQHRQQLLRLQLQSGGQQLTQYIGHVPYRKVRLGGRLVGLEGGQLSGLRVGRRGVQGSQQLEDVELRRAGGGGGDAAGAGEAGTAEGT